MIARCKVGIALEPAWCMTFSGKATLVEHEGLAARGSSPRIAVVPASATAHVALTPEQKAQEQARFEALWTRYHEQCGAAANASDDDGMPLDIHDRVQQSRSAMVTLEGFAAYLRSIDDDLAALIRKADQLAATARDTYENALRNSMRWTRRDAEAA